MSNAWSILRKELVSTFSEALKLAWKKSKFIHTLMNGIVEFSFRKKDGSVRGAKGTLMAKYLPASKGGKSYGHLVTYFDLDKNAFRSFIANKLITQ